MQIVRWTLLLLYLGLVVGLFALGFSEEDHVGVWVLLGVTVTADALFILGSGNKDLFRPIRRRRIVLPVTAASFMLAVLVASLTVAMTELIEWKDCEWGFWVLIGLCWIFWGILLYAYTRKLPRYPAICRLANVVFAGSLVELLAAAPAHIIVTRRGGCMTGLATGFGVLAGIYVMIWSFGPAVFLLFLQEARRRESRHLPAGEPDDRPLHVTGRLQFRLRTLLLLMLAASIFCSMLKTFWLHWISLAIIALVGMMLAAALLAASRWLMAIASLGGIACLVWVSCVEEQMSVVFAIPACILTLLQLKLFLRRQ